jgi:hypothetical protein
MDRTEGKASKDIAKFVKQGPTFRRGGIITKGIPKRISSDILPLNDDSDIPDGFVPEFTPHEESLLRDKGMDPEKLTEDEKLQAITEIMLEEIQ